MLSPIEIRKQKIHSIKTSMKSISLIHHNSSKIQAKQEKNKNRKESLQIADSFTSQQLIRKFSEEDQEEERKNIDTFHQKYIILQKIGQGANALVESCEYKSTKKKYAVKIMTMDEQHILELKKNFLSIKQLRHSSIIKYHALYLDSKKHAAYLIMQHFPFPNLLEANIKEQAQLKNVFRELLDAVRYIHDKNICHRDIKPENILYDAGQKKVKIIDFGISKKTYQRGTRRDMLTITGTSLYLAPEILCGGGYDERVDVWSIGITLYRLIAGVTPFQSEYHSDTVNNIIAGKVNFDPDIWGNYHFLAKDLVIRLLKDRNERLSAKVAVKHLWLNQDKSPKDKRNDSQQTNKFARTETFNPKIYKAFNQEQGSNMINALSKEQGQKQSDYDSPRVRTIAKRIHLMENQQFDLQDSSQDEDYSPELQKLKKMDNKLTKAKSN